jgi:hypothetical protein
MADPGRRAACGTDHLDVRDVDEHLGVDDPALLQLLRAAARASARRTLVLLRESDAIHHHAAFPREHAHDAPFPTAVLARDHPDGVVLLDVDSRHRYSTSGARDTIFM